MMPKEEFIRAARAIALSEHLPPTVREAVISDAAFREKYNLKADPIIAFARGEVAFQQTVFDEALDRAFAAPGADIEIHDTSERVWRISFLGMEDPPKIAIRREEQRFLVVQTVLKAPEADARLRAFDFESARFRFPTEVVDRWRGLVASRPLGDDELTAFAEDSKQTVGAVEHALNEFSRTDSIPMEILVPRQVQYYNRFVGQYCDGQTLSAFIKQTAKPHVAVTLERGRREDYTDCLMIAAQPQINSAIETGDMPVSELKAAFRWLVEHGDPLSCAAAAEAGFNKLDVGSIAEEPFSELAEFIIARERRANVDPYDLFSALFGFVDGELAYIRTHAGKPPFWRRLCSLAQAALIFRCIIANMADASEFLEQIHYVRSEPFQLACLVDLRTDPRWVSEFASPRQIANELIGRVFCACESRRLSTTESEMRDGPLKGLSERLRSLIVCGAALLPGPLEGATDAVLAAPEQMLSELRAEFSGDQVKLGTYLTLSNALLFFLVPEDIIASAADALVRMDYYIGETDDDEIDAERHFLAIATAAAIARSQLLADALLIAVRKYRFFHLDKLPIEGEFRIAMIAAACNKDLAAWCDFVGLRMTELAYQEMTADEARTLHSHVKVLCQLEPDLWTSCGRAEAALRSIRA